jgi:hypothetical protein
MWRLRACLAAVTAFSRCHAEHLQHRCAAACRGAVAVSLLAGVALGLTVALLQISRPGSSSSSGGANVQSQQPAHADLERLQAQVAQLTRERDEARLEASELRDASTTSVGAAAAVAGTCPDRHTPWQPTPERGQLYPELDAFLKKVHSTECNEYSLFNYAARAATCCRTGHPTSDALPPSPSALFLPACGFHVPVFSCRSPSTTRCSCRSATATTPGRGACCSCGQRM